MKNSLKKKMVGGFVLGSVAILITMLMLFGSGRLFQDSFQFVCYFPSSLKGLTAGSPVNLHGVTIGRVVNIHIQTDQSTFEYSTPVIIEMDKSTMFHEDDSLFLSQDDADLIIAEYVENGLRAQLATQSYLTGQLAVDLSISPQANETPINALELPRYDDLMQIPTLASPFDTVLSNISDIPFAQIATKLDEFALQLTNIATNVNKIFEEADVPLLVTSYTNLAINLDRELQNFASLKDTIETVLLSISTASGSINNLVDTNSPEVQEILYSLNTLIQRANTLTEELNTVLEEDSATMIEIGQTLDAVQGASDSVAQLADLLAIQPDALLFGK